MSTQRSAREDPRGAAALRSRRRTDGCHCEPSRRRARRPRPSHRRRDVAAVVRASRQCCPSGAARSCVARRPTGVASPACIRSRPATSEHSQAGGRFRRVLRTRRGGRGGRRARRRRVRDDPAAADGGDRLVRGAGPTRAAGPERARRVPRRRGRTRPAPSGRALIAAASALERWSYARCAAVTVLSADMRTNLAAKMRQPDRLHVIPNFVDVEVVRPGPKENSYRAEYGSPARPS